MPTTVVGSYPQPGWLVDQEAPIRPPPDRRAWSLESEGLARRISSHLRHPAMALTVLPPIAFLIMARVTFVLWLNYKFSVGFLTDIFREHFSATLHRAGPRPRSLLKGFLVRLVLVCGLVAPIVWDPTVLFVGYLFYPILGFPLVAATAELGALLFYAWRARRIGPETEALLKA